MPPMSDANVMQLIMFGNLTISGVLTYLMARLKASHTASDEIARQTQAIAESTHILVNSSMSEQLRIGAAALRRIADITQDSHDVDVAVAAEKKSRDHEKKQ